VGTGKAALKRGKMTSKMQRVLSSMGYETEEFRSTPINEADLDWADKVVCMGNPHIKRIEEEFPQYTHKVEMWKIMDPHFSKGEENHRMVAEQIRDLVFFHFSPQ
jgi:protein-tyrosine-phosphatase